MACPYCGTENRVGASFCRQCGRLLGAHCPRCRSAVEQPANFCDACGYPLGPRAWVGDLAANRLEPVAAPRLPAVPPPRMPSASPDPPPVPAPEPTFDLERYIPRELAAKLRSARETGLVGERRVVTILFCDIKGSTELAEHLDPEEWSEIVNGAFARMVPPVYKYEGTVARLTGDGLLAFFGAPIAHEDDPRRAILAGLEIVDGIHAYRQTLPSAGRDLDVRVGINTGLVVVGAVGSDMRLEYSALGDAINLAARMEQTATPGTVRIADDTFRLVAGQFAVEPLGGIAVKGKSQPVSAYRVLRRRSGRELRQFQTPFHSPLVNRSREWEMLRLAFEGLGQGRGGIFYLTGDAGLGKSRLMYEAVERLLPETSLDGRSFESIAYAYEAGLPYGLVTRLVRQSLGIMPGDPAEVIHERLSTLDTGDVDDSQAARVLEALFGLSPEQPGAGLAGEMFARQLLDCLTHYWRGLAAAGPIVLVLDDLQWADASSADLIGQLFQLVERDPILFLCAVRRDRHTPGWRLKETAERELPHRLTEAALYPLTDIDSRELLAGLLGASDLPEILRSLILQKAEGNPLFVEEVVHHLIERGHLVREADGAPWSAASTVDNIDLPDSLQALLTARIDRLDDDTRRTLQVASVIGRFFPLSPLAALVDEPSTLDRHLLELQRMDLIREVTRVPEPGYTFNHALTHEATYNTILLKQRRAMHLRVAETIESLRAGDGLAVVAPVLAHHFFEGNAPDRALPFLIMAADTALQLHATTEAIAYYERALQIALDRDAAAAEIAKLYTCRGRALELQSKFAEADLTYQDLEQKAVARGDKTLELEALVAQGKLRANVTPLHNPVTGRQLMDRALSLAEELDDRAAEVRIIWNLVNIDRFDINTLDHAIVLGTRGVAMARELGLREELAYLLNDLSDVYGTVGRMKEVWDALYEAQDLWRELGNEPMLADTLSNTAMWTFIKGDPEKAFALTNEAYAITTRIDNPWGQAYSRGVRGQATSFKGEISRAIEDMTAAIDKGREANFVGGQVLCFCFLSRVYLNIGDLERARESALASLELARDFIPQFAGMAIGRLAWTQMALGDIPAAAETLADPAASLEHQQVFVQNDIQMARLELALVSSQPLEALRLADEEVATLTEMEYRGWLPDAEFGRARALAALGQTDQARESFSRCVALSREMAMRGLLWRFLATWADFEATEGFDEEADHLFREAQEEIDYLRETMWTEDLRQTFDRHPLVRLVRDHLAGQAAPLPAGSGS